MPTKWQRLHIFDITGTKVTGLTQLSINIGGGSQITAGNPPNPSYPLYLWGAQMVVGSSPGALISTQNTTTYAATGANAYRAANGLDESYSCDAFGDLQPSGNESFIQAYSQDNRLFGWSYDANGNLLIDGNNNSYSSIGVSVDRARSTGRDAAGTRVARGRLSSFSCNFATNGYSTTTSWVLGPESDLAREQVTEYAVSGSASTWVHTNVFAGAKLNATYSGTDTYFALSDWLGTKRVEVNATGACATAYQSLPFGNGLAPATVTLLGTALPQCGPDATEHHFTGKERDAESGLDYFPARMYGSSMGRFMSPDPSGLYMADPANPQQLNLYAYVGNNPLRFTDPLGLSSDCGGGGDPSVVCMVTTAWDWLKNVLGGSGNSGSNNGNQNSGEESSPGAGQDGTPNLNLSPGVNPQRFQTRDAAGIAAARQAIGPTSQKDANGYKYEWGGRILQSKQSGQYTFTNPVTFHSSVHFWASHVMVPFGYRNAGSYHTHPGIGAPGMSMGDAGWSASQRLPEYMGEEMSGKVWKYDPSMGCSSEPCGAVLSNPPSLPQ